jgi:hypothetical protein
LNIYLADLNSRAYTFYVINCKRFFKLQVIDWWNSIQFAPVLCCFAFSFGYIFIQMDQIASYVLTVPIEKNMIYTSFFYSYRLTFVLCFSSTRVSFGFFSTKLHVSCSSKNWYRLPQHHVEQQFQLTHPVGFTKSL